jgi:hypothetical protein
MPTALQLHNHYNLAHSSKYAKTINTTSYQILYVGNPNRHKFHRNTFGLAAPTYNVGPLIGPRQGNITEQEAAQLLTQLEGLSFPNYANAKNDARWQRLYHYQNRNLLFRNQVGAEALSVNLPSFPCHYCGIILPTELIQVDHQLPKGGPPGAPLLKCLHSLNANLTAADAHGSKNTQTGAITAANNAPAIAALNQIPTKYRGFGAAWAAQVLPLPGAHGQRYSLTAKGITLLSLGTMYFGIQGFTQLCVNNFLNLVPACALCNGAAGKGNVVHAH